MQILTSKMWCVIRLADVERSRNSIETEDSKGPFLTPPSELSEHHVLHALHCV